MSLHTAIQTAILDAIKEPGFNAALPPLSDQKWAEILHTYPSAKEENERLEFVGDALMYATLGRQLYTQIPVGSAHLYTTIRGALHSNVTFSCLAEKLDILAVSDTIMRALTRRKFGEGIFEASKIKRTAKPIADLFEVIIAAYYFERGFEPLNAWVNELYRPLIDIAHRAFIQYRTHPSSNKMKRKLAVTASVPASKKPKLMSTSSGDHVLPKRQVLPLPRHMLTGKSVFSMRSFHRRQTCPKHRSTCSRFSSSHCEDTSRTIMGPSSYSCSAEDSRYCVQLPFPSRYHRPYWRGRRL
ncbi:hypothetical protein C8Q75DRAFT_768731 [Abortiporus biennis]|nr:hypothetical protein C8Q75DRAFT_768731 [Abortiporus biennis]